MYLGHINSLLTFRRINHWLCRRYLHQAFWTTTRFIC